MCENHRETALKERLRRFHEGTEDRAWELFGAHTATADGQVGTRFRVWAPNAQSVSLICSANG